MSIRNNCCVNDVVLYSCVLCMFLCDKLAIFDVQFIGNWVKRI